jgi:hypothetical protein
MLHAEGAYPYRGAAKHRTARLGHARSRLGAAAALYRVRGGDADFVVSGTSRYISRSGDGGVLSFCW